MCGRYTLTAEADELVEVFDVPDLTFEHRPRFNVAPGQSVPVLAQDRKGRRLGLLEWGLVPSWADDPGTSFINARAESVAEKPSFREAFRKRRCLLPADGFYEWKREGGRKQPYWFHRDGRELFTFAGIWEAWTGAGGDPRHTVAILTTDANADVAGVHDRMPVVIGAGDRDRWLDWSVDSGALSALLGPSADDSFRSHPVSTRVNTPDQDDPKLVEPA